MVARGEIWLTELDPTRGSEIEKTRPCLIVSPPELHDYLRTAIVVPMTTRSTQTSYRIPVAFEGKRGLLVLDQIRTVERIRMLRRLGAAEDRTVAAALEVLRRMFSV